MVDTDLPLIKAGNVRKHLKRAREKCDSDLAAFLSNRDHQDIVCFNLQMAINDKAHQAFLAADKGEAVIIIPRMVCW